MIIELGSVNMNIYLAIEIIGSLLYLLHKVFLSIHKRFGWIFGILGALAFTIVTMHNGSYAYAILEITSGVTFIFGLLLWGEHSLVNKYTTIAMSFFALLGIGFVFIFNLGSPNWLLESTEVTFFAVGALCLVLKRPSGWLLYGVGHIFLAYYTFLLGLYFIMALQIISIPLAVVGYKNFSQKSVLIT